MSGGQIFVLVMIFDGWDWDGQIFFEVHLFSCEAPFSRTLLSPLLLSSASPFVICHHSLDHVLIHAVINALVTSSYSLFVVLIIARNVFSIIISIIVSITISYDIYCSISA